MTRRQKTSRQRAEETLAIAKRRVDRLNKQRKQLQSQVDQVARELDEAKARFEYASKDPALDQGTSTAPATPRESGGTTA